MEDESNNEMTWIVGVCLAIAIIAALLAPEGYFGPPSDDVSNYEYLEHR